MSELRALYTSLFRCAVGMIRFGAYMQMGRNLVTSTMHPGVEFYEGWANEQLSDPFRDITLQWKAVHLANLFRRGCPDYSVDTICEVGGAEGTVIATVGQLLKANKMHCYDLSAKFCKVGSTKYPWIRFLNAAFDGEGDCYDIIILSDITEHVDDDMALLCDVSKRSRFVLLKMPIEECVATAEWAFWLRGKAKPLELKYGRTHYNGHLRGYSRDSAINAVNHYFDVLASYDTDISFYYQASTRFNFLRKILGLTPLVWLFGGSLFVLGKSKVWQN